MPLSVLLRTVSILSPINACKAADYLFAGDYIKVTCDTSTLTHYLVVHKGDPIIHMATYTTEGQLVCC